MQDRQDVGARAGRRWSGRARLGRVALLLAGLGLLLLTLDGLRIAAERQAALAEARREGAVLVGTIALHAEGTLATTKALLSGLVAHLEGDGWASGRLPRFTGALVEGQASVGWIALVAFYDPAGTRLLGPDGSPTRDIKARPYLAAHRDSPDRDVRVGIPVLGRASGRWVLPVTRRVDNPDGSFAGVALVALDLERLFDTYHALGLPPGAVLASFAADGTLLMRHPLVAESIGRLFVTTPMAAAIRAGTATGDVDQISPVDGRAMLSSYRRFDGGRMVMVLGLDREAALAGWRAATAWHLAGVVLLAAVIWVLFTLLDRGDRRRAAAELARARLAAKRQVLAQHASDIVLEHDLAFRCRYVSASTLDHLGRDAGGVLGTRLLDALDPADPAAVERLFARAARGGAGVRGEVMLHRPGGRETWVEIVLERFERPGEAALILGVMRDVTARHAAEIRAADALAELRARHADLLRAERIAHVGHWRLDAGGTGLAMSDEACRIHALPLLGGAADGEASRSRAATNTTLDGLLATIHEEERDRVRAAMYGARDDAAGCGFRVDYRALRPDGGVRHVACFGEPERDASGRLTRVIGVIQDVTERVLIERELRHEHKMRTIGRLAAGVAHDFNNLLQSVVGCLELIGDAVPRNSPADRYLAMALASAERGSALTRQLLSCARKQVLAPCRIEAGALLVELQHLLERTLGPQVAVRTEVAAGVAAFRADPAHLQAALLNLGVNAGHAMPAGGTLTLSAAGCRGRVVLAVADTGTGMDAATLAQASEPFFTTKGAGGTGLGLAMVNGSRSNPVARCG